MDHFHYEQIKDDTNLYNGISKYDISYAGGGANTRSTQLFIALGNDLDFLGKEPWETPFGSVIEGHEVMDKLYKGYGEIVPFNNNGPDQQQIFRQGNSYLNEHFPRTKCEMISEDTSEL